MTTEKGGELRKKGIGSLYFKTSVSAPRYGLKGGFQGTFNNPYGADGRGKFGTRRCKMDTDAEGWTGNLKKEVVPVKVIIDRPEGFVFKGRNSG